MKKLNFLSGFSVTLAVCSIAQGNYNHLWPIGENMCRGPWVGSHYYTDVLVAKSTEDVWVDNWIPVKESNINTYLVGYPNGEIQHVYQSEVGKYIREDDPLVIERINQICERAKDDIIQQYAQQGKKIVRIDAVPKVNRHPGPHIDSIHVRTEGRRDDKRYIHQYIFVMHVDCDITLDYEVIKNVPKKDTVTKYDYSWKRSSKTKTSFVFKNSYLAQTDTSIPPKKVQDSEGSDPLTWAHHKYELQDLLTQEPVYLGIKNPLLDKRWDENHQFTDAYCSTCDDLPAKTPLEIELKRKCLKAAIYTFSGLAKGLKIDDSPIVFELIYELKELYKNHMDSISSDKVDEAKSFIQQFKHIKSKLPGFGSY